MGCRRAAWFLARLSLLLLLSVRAQTGEGNTNEDDEEGSGSGEGEEASALYLARAELRLTRGEVIFTFAGHAAPDTLDMTRCLVQPTRTSLQEKTFRFGGGEVMLARHSQTERRGLDDEWSELTVALLASDIQALRLRTPLGLSPQYTYFSFEPGFVSSTQGVPLQLPGVVQDSVNIVAGEDNTATAHSNDDGTGAGVIAGSVLGAVGLLMLLVVVAIKTLRNQRDRRHTYSPAKWGARAPAVHPPRTFRSSEGLRHNVDAEHRTEAAPNGESDPLMQETPSGAFAAPDPKDHAPPSAAAIKDAKQAGRLPYVVPPSLSPQDNNERREGTMPPSGGGPSITGRYDLDLEGDIATMVGTPV